MEFMKKQQQERNTPSKLRKERCDESEEVSEEQDEEEEAGENGSEYEDEGEAEAEEGEEGTATKNPATGPAKTRENGTITVTLSDPEVLDCCICCEPLSIPVFQCKNGHIACSSCCRTMRNRCPSCCSPIGNKRCRAIEDVLDSIKIKCQFVKYGCKETVSYSKKSEHQKACGHAPSSCPFSNCEFIGSATQLYVHISNQHPKSSTANFRYNTVQKISMDVHETIYVLKEEKDGLIFVLNNKSGIMGNTIWMNCITPSGKGLFYYDILVRREGGVIKFHSFTKGNRNGVDDLPSTGSLMLPSDTFGAFAELSLDLCIWRPGSTPAHVSRK